MKGGISAELLAHYASGSTTLARLWKVTRRDGQVFGFTDHDKRIEFDSVWYEVSSTFDASAIQTSAELNVDTLSVMGIQAAAGVTADDVEAGLWDGAAIEVVEVNHQDLTMGANVLRVGDVGQIQRNGQKFSAELRGLMQTLQNNIGRIVTPSCDAVLGDDRCKVDLEAMRETGLVTVAESTRQFAVSGITDTADWFRYGVITWVDGLNAGLSMEVRSHAGNSDAGSDIELQLDMPYTISVGDEFTITPGCNKIGRLGDCKVKFDNYLNFRGFEDLPGQDKILLVGGQ